MRVGWESDCKMHVPQRKNSPEAQAHVVLVRAELLAPDVHRVRRVRLEGVVEDRLRHKGIFHSILKMSSQYVTIMHVASTIRWNGRSYTSIPGKIVHTVNERGQLVTYDIATGKTISRDSVPTCT